MTDTFDITALKESQKDTPADQPADKPADQPADKPADQPADQPADKPADQPADKPADQPADKPADQPADDAMQKATEALLKKLGVKTMEELEQKTKTPETPEEISKKAEEFKTSVDKYAVTNGYLKRDDIIALENMKTADPEALVYSDFAKAYKEKNTEATPDQIKQEFDLFYHVNSENAVLKQSGQDLIKSAAANKVAALENKYKEAEELYKQELSEKSKLPEFKTLVQSVVKAKVPDSLELYKDGETPITFNITAEDRSEVEKFLVTQDAFEEFLEKGNGQPIRSYLEDRVAGFLFLKNKEAILKTVFDSGVSKGAKSGSTVGATAPFEIQNQPAPVIVDETKLTDDDTAKIKSVLGG